MFPPPIDAPVLCYPLKKHNLFSLVRSDIALIRIYALPNSSATTKSEIKSTSNTFHAMGTAAEVAEVMEEKM